MSDASLAMNHFQKGNYDSSLELLNQIRNKIPNDNRLQHNLLIAQYLADNRKNSSKLLDGLEKLRNKVGEADFPTTTTSSSGEQSSIRIPRCDHMASYNLSVVLLQSKSFERGLQIACEIFDQAQWMPMWLAVRTALLIAELGLQSARQRGELSGDLSNKVNSALDWMEARGAASGGKVSAGAGVFDSQVGQGDHSLDGKMVKFAIHTYRAKFALMQGSKNACKREMKGAQDVLDSNWPQAQQYSVGLSVLRAQLQYSLSDYSNSLEIIGSIANLAEGSVAQEDYNAATIYFNNLGCIHHRMKKFNGAVFYFTRALAMDDKSNAASTHNKWHGLVPNNAYSSVRLYDVLYNLGITLLQTGKPQLALECLHDSLPGRCEGWKVWLRQGECVVASHVQILKVERRKYKNNLGVEAGSRDKLRIILPTEYTCEGVPFVDKASVAPPQTKSSKKDAPETAGPAVAPSLAYGEQCLSNAIALCNFTDTDKEKVSHRPPITHARLALAYLGLNGEQPLLVLDQCQRLLEGGKSLPTELLQLARVYIAEALAMLTRHDESIAHLQQAIQDSNTEEGSTDTKGGGGGLRLVVLTNLVTCHIFQGDLDKAERVLQLALSGTNNPSPELYLLQAYLSLRRHDVFAVLSLLKRGRPIPRRAKGK